MRWIPFIVLIYLVLLVQTTVGKILTFTGGGLGRVGPDLLAIVVVFAALHTRSVTDVALAAWAAGLGLDLTTAGGPGATAVLGPMSLAYVVAAWIVYRLREAVFRERALPQALLALIFCAAAHGTWVTLQTALGGGAWADYGRHLALAAALSVYTAVLMPLGHLALVPVRGLIIAAPAERSRRAR